MSGLLYTARLRKISTGYSIALKLAKCGRHIFRAGRATVQSADLSQFFFVASAFVFGLAALRPYLYMRFVLARRSVWVFHRLPAGLMPKVMQDGRLIAAAPRLVGWQCHWAARRLLGPALRWIDGRSAIVWVSRGKPGRGMAALLLDLLAGWQPTCNMAVAFEVQTTALRAPNGLKWFFAGPQLVIHNDVKLPNSARFYCRERGRWLEVERSGLMPHAGS